ncbi:MAG: glycosyl hydrolase family 31 [Bacteroidales bacterium]|nr:glycosyl hydrolase family 31 [Bacteroidales bacterium]
MKKLLTLAALMWIAISGLAAQTPGGTEILPGIWKFTFGTPDSITPVSIHDAPPRQEAIAALGSDGACPVIPQAEFGRRGVLLTLPLKNDELLYGLGLQLQSFQQRGKKKMLRVNADPRVDTGDSHAPVPFYVSSAGYGVLIDNARYMTFYLGSKRPEGAASDAVKVEIPRSEGVDVYVFAGPTMKEAVARYNLFAGGGTLVPRWGLGFWYRGETDFTQEQILALAEDFRANRLPCDVIGLEPHWQTASYSCSYVWRGTFPDPAAMIGTLREQGIRTNLWMHAYVHPSAPIHDALKPYSGDYRVWNGLVPDLTLPEAREIFKGWHAQATTGIGVSGFKLDECDNSDFTGNWCFPEIASFPSGADGEQMHSLFGLAIQQTIDELYRERGVRGYHLVRSSGAMAAPLPCVLYSDLYDSQVFINAVAQSGFCGLLWTPEVRDANGEEDFLRRFQAVMCSPLAMVNAWYLQMPPWKQMNREKSKRHIVDPGSPEMTDACRKWLEFRMTLIPYLHAAFVKYHETGIPPFRALVMDFPDETAAVKDIAGQYMMGDELMVAPLTATSKGTKTIYFPAGTWYDFFTGERIEGGQALTLSFPLDRMPLYVKEGAILPLAHATLSTEDPDSRILDFRVYGDDPRPTAVYEDDGGYPAQLKENQIHWDAKRARIRFQSKQYTSGKTIRIPSGQPGR